MNNPNIQHSYNAEKMTRRALYYLRLGMAVTPIKYGDKIPVGGAGWNKPENLLTTPGQVRAKFSRPFNIGIQLGASGLVSLDIDNWELAAREFEEAGMSLDEVVDQHPHPIKGRGLRLWFLAPEDSPITTRRFSTVNDTTAYEIRGGNGFQDVAPGSLHPSGVDYIWPKGAPQRREDLPVMPRVIGELWEKLGRKKDKGDDSSTPAPPRRTYSPESWSSESVIDRYDVTIAPEEVLVRNGYKRRGDRFMSPNSSTKLAGVTIYEQNGKRYAVTYHGSDEWSDGHGKTSFGLLKELEHHGDLKASLDAAREELGLPAFEPQKTYVPNSTYSEATLVRNVKKSPVLDAETVQANWTEHLTEVLGEVGERLTQTQIHHHARDAMWLLMDYIYTEAAEGNIALKDGRWYVMCGGLKGLKAAGVPGRLSDISARLKLAGNSGLLGRVERVDPNDRYSPLAIEIPADPRDLAFLQRSKKALAAMVLRPDTVSAKRPRKKAVRDTEKTYVPNSTYSEATLVRNVNTARCQAQYFLAREQGRLTELPASAVKAVEALGLTAQATYAEVKAAARLELENDPLHRARYMDLLEATAKTCRHRLRLARFGVKEAQRSAGRTRTLLKRTLERMERLRDGEPISEVRRWAA